MMNIKNTAKRAFKCLVFTLAFFLAVASGASIASADEVVLIPATITGTIQMGGLPVNNITVYANWQDQSASTTVNGNGANSVSYNLTVNVPQGTTPEYNVNGSGYFNGNQINIQFASRTVIVTENETHTVDLGSENPARIEGTIQMGSEKIHYVSLTASGGGARSRINFYPDTSPESPTTTYSIPVDIPGSEPVTFTIPYYYTNVYLNDSDHRIRFGNKSVTVSPGSTATLDMGTSTPAYIVGNVTVNNETLDYAWIYTSASYNDPRAQVKTNSSGAYRMAVMPDINYEVRGNAYMVGGSRFSLPSEFTVPSAEQYAAPSGGETANVSWTLNVGYGSIAGTFTVNGPESFDRHRFNSGSPDYENVYLYENGPYEITDLAAGTHHPRGYTYYDSGYDRYTYYPYSAITGGSSTSRPTAFVSPGQTTVVDISANQAFISGSWTISGTHSLSEVYNDLYLNLYGTYNTDSYGGGGRDKINKSDQTYKVILTDGIWRYSNIYEIEFRNYDPVEYLNSEIRYFYDYTAINNPVTLTAGETANRDFHYKTGDVTVTFLIEGGGTLSNPRLNGTCERRDEDSNELIWEYDINAYSNQQNVEIGSVTMVGFEGTCNVTARAYVDGSYTTFGQIELEVIPGADVVIDIGGPILDVENPEPDFISYADLITVTGTVTDDVEVASVSVNGIEAALFSTNNPDDPAEMTFIVDIVLGTKGPNEIVTVATDTSDKTTTDTRTVYWDELPPTVNWTPDDGTNTSETTVTVIGTATDDAGIAGITVNGEPVEFESTGNPYDPNEVSFTSDSILLNEDGETPITVVVTDISTQTVSQTHYVTYIENQAPVAVLEPIDDADLPLPVTMKVTPQTLNLDRLGKWVKAHICEAAGAVQEVVVVFDGSGSYDLDEDEITFIWTLVGPNGEIALDEIATPSASLPPGSYTISLLVNDGMLDSTPTTLSFTLTGITVYDLPDGQYTLNGVPDSEVKPDDDDANGCVVISFEDDAVASTIDVGPDVEMVLGGTAVGIDYIDVIEGGSGGSKGKSGPKFK